MAGFLRIMVKGQGGHKLEVLVPDGANLTPQDIHKIVQKKLPEIEQVSGVTLQPVGGGDPLPGAPSMPNIPGRGKTLIGRNEKALRAAEQYAEKSGVPLEQVYEYVGVDEDRARRIADEYARMKHNPNDPEVKKAYEALADETLGQYESMLSQGVEPYFIRGKDPYQNSPYEALIELDETNRLGVFPTDEGFGTQAGFDPSGNPLLRDSGFEIGGEPAAVNDIFRAVHDYYGHAKQGAGFRAMGEENAYQSHAGMFTPEARRALATETRGQNSWLNYGPEGEANRTATVDDTVFADQKTGIMPNWAVEGGRVGDRRSDFQRAVQEGRTGLEGAVDDAGQVSLTHYARQPLERISPDEQLTGLASRSERNRLSGPDAGPKRSYYGIEADINPYKKESGLGAHKHKALLDGELLYDAATDIDKLAKGDANAFEQAVKDKNYSGYYFDHPQLGKVAVVYDELSAQKLNEAGFANPVLLAGTAAATGTIGAMMSQDAEGRIIAPRSTIRGAQRKAYPGVYKDPKTLLDEVNVAPEDPMMERLFGVTRQDLADISARPGTQTGVVPGAPANPKGSKAAEPIMKPANTQRLVDLQQEARDTPLGVGMRGWYVMDPFYQRMVELWGPEEGHRRYIMLNNFSGMSSPGSDVLTEINRGSSAYMLNEKGRFDDFMKYGGGTEPGAPADMSGVLGHMYHKTAQGLPMQNYLDSGELQMKSPKVPLYIQASGVPETGFQTDFMVGDAHWSRGVGLADTRTNANPGASYTTPEALSLRDWWRDDVAAQADLEAVPAQAVQWGAMAPQTGVATPVGAPKLELWAQQIARAAQKRRVTPEEARDAIMRGEYEAGRADPRLLAGTAGAGGTAAYAASQFGEALGRAGNAAELFGRGLTGMGLGGLQAIATIAKGGTVSDASKEIEWWANHMMEKMSPEAQQGAQQMMGETGANARALLGDKPVDMYVEGVVPYADQAAEYIQGQGHPRAGAAVGAGLQGLEILMP